MDVYLLLNIQRRVLGGYINAEEFSINGSGERILEIKLEEALFDDILHRACVRACNNLQSDNIPVTEYTVFDFLQRHNMPKGQLQESEYLQLMSEYQITFNSFKTYIDMILKYKMEL